MDTGACDVIKYRQLGWLYPVGACYHYRGKRYGRRRVRYRHRGHRNRNRDQRQVLSQLDRQRERGIQGKSLHLQGRKEQTITANLQGGQSDGIIGGEELTGDWASAVYDENLEVTINWWRLQPVYFVGDTLQVSEYPVESFTDERANEVDDYETMLRIAGEDGAEELVSNAEGYTFTQAGKYTLYRYALKDGKYAKPKGFEIQVLAPDGTAPEGVELHNGAVVGGEYVLKRSTVNGSMGNILEGTADFSYVAFTKEDGYGPGTWVTVTFTG